MKEGTQNQTIRVRVKDNLTSNTDPYYMDFIGQEINVVNIGDYFIHKEEYDKVLGSHDEHIELLSKKDCEIVPPSLSKEEAIEAMRQGAKVRHRHFGDEEWVSSNPSGSQYQFEDGYGNTSDIFWQYRTDESFLTDWSIVSPPSVESKDKAIQEKGHSGLTLKEEKLMTAVLGEGWDKVSSNEKIISENYQRGFIAVNNWGELRFDLHESGSLYKCNHTNRLFTKEQIQHGN